MDEKEVKPGEGKDGCCAKKCCCGGKAAAALALLLLGGAGGFFAARHCRVCAPASTGAAAPQAPAQK